MRKLRLKRIHFPLCVWMLLLFVRVFSAPMWTGLRQNEVAIIVADSLPLFINAEINQLHAYSYSKITNSWRQIPFQIDEKGPEIVQNFYDSTRIDTLMNYFGELNGTLDAGEELLFALKDAGDPAPDGKWLANDAARDHPRYEIAVTDPINPLATGFIYLYQSASLISDPALADYVLLTTPTSDTTANDIIYGQSYLEGHNLNGFTTDWLIPLAAQGTDTDILDFLKMRLKVNFGFIVKILEVDALKFRKLDYVDGKIRVIRRLNYFLEFALFTEPVGIADFTSFYYPYHTDVRGPSKRLDPSWGVSYLRQSFDLNASSVGMTFSNPYNSSVLIDGQTDQNINKTLNPLPELNWHLITGQHGSVLFRYPVPDIGITRELYYLDSETELSGDGFGRDSGDGKSYGDIGISVTGERMEGNLGMSYEAIFLGANQSAGLGPEFVALKANPVAVNFKSIMFDKIAPATISDLQITGYTLNSITLGWTAPAEDGVTGGPISQYEIKYSEFPMMDDFTEWLVFAKTTKSTPVPVAPGQPQFFLVTGLKANQTYYFSLRSQDDAGNWSAWSNFASGTAFPVELGLFEVTAENDAVQLKWQTLSESNNHGFQIEKKPPVSGAWEVIGFISGKGTTQVVQSYAFTDRNVNWGVYQYRLKQIDRDGSFKYSEIKTVSIEGPKSFKLSQNFPNPFNPTTQIEFQIPVSSGEESVSVAIQIFDLLGNQVRMFSYSNLAPGRHTLVWDGKDDTGNSVAAGIYFYQLHTTKVILSRKMMLLP